MSAIITVTITKPNEVVWQGSADALVSQNTEGEFAIVPEHARFMTILRAVPLTLFAAEQELFAYHVDEAVLFFENNIATVFIQPPMSESDTPQG